MAEQTAPPGAAEAGPVLGEEARRAVQDAISGEVDAWRLENVAKVVTVFLDPIVRALVAAAREEGRREERERVADAIRRAEFAYEGYQHPEAYRGGYVDGLGFAEDIARGYES